MSLSFMLLEFVFPLQAKVLRLKFFHIDLISFLAVMVVEFFTRAPIHQTYVKLIPYLPDVGHYFSSPFKIVLTFILSDFLLYWYHRASHLFPILWRAHRWHHSAQSLYWFSGLRSSMIENVLYAIIQVFAGTLIFKLNMTEMTVVFTFGIFCQYWSHSNVRTPKWLPLHYVFVTPEFHHPHHSLGDISKRNYGSMLSIWDWMFKTAYPKAVYEKEHVYGLTKPKSTWRMIIGL